MIEQPDNKLGRKFPGLYIKRADFYGFWGDKDFYGNYTPYHQYTLQPFFTRNSVNFQGSLQELQSLPCQIPIVFIKNPVKFKKNSTGITIITMNTNSSPFLCKSCKLSNFQTVQLNLSILDNVDHPKIFSLHQFYNGLPIAYSIIATI